METVSIEVAGGGVVPVRLLAARGPRAASQVSRPVIVIIPGLGVPAAYYGDFAVELTGRGFDVAIGELRGNGDSRPKPNPRSTYGYQELVAGDFPAILGAVRHRFPDSTPVLLGHSMGGQLATMYAARVRGRLGGLILIASGTPYYLGYGGLARPAMRLGPAAVSLTARVAGFWPGDVITAGGFGRQSKVLIADWARVARTGRFVPADADIDYEERIGRLQLPVLSITVAGDELTPPGSAAHLLAKLPQAPVTTWHQSRPRGHNGWIAEPRTTVDRIETWLRGR